MTYQPVELLNVRHVVSLAPGEFTTHDMAHYFPQVKESTGSLMELQMCLEGLVESGELERSGNRRGWYRTPNKDLRKMDVRNANSDAIDIWLPFGLSKLCKTMPGNVISIGGEKNSGKSSLMMSIAHDNARNMDVHYFNSEMGAGEVKLRIELFNEINHTGWTTWDKVNFYERSSDFADVIVSGHGNLNIIDFFEVHDEFWKIGEGIRKIHDRLDGAVCILAIQKNPGNSDPLGGRRATEKSRIHLSLEFNYARTYPHRLKIEVGKNWANQDLNPRGMFVDFKIARGCYFKCQEVPDGTGKPTIWQREKV